MWRRGKKISKMWENESRVEQKASSTLKLTRSKKNLLHIKFASYIAFTGTISISYVLRGKLAQDASLFMFTQAL